MSYAWKQLRLAVRALAGGGSQRECLVNAYARLMPLKPKDLPFEIRAEFAKLMHGPAMRDGKSVRENVRAMVAMLPDAAVVSAVHSIIDMYDAVARYQPVPAIAARIPMEEEEDTP